MADPLDVTGYWDGIFNYPRTMPPNAFTADLREDHGRIVGETCEPSDSPHDQASELHALIEGMRSGADVTFTKFYDSTRRLDPIAYRGTLSADATEINGTWSIPGNWSGTFIMVRTTREAVLADQSEAASVP